MKRLLLALALVAAPALAQNDEPVTTNLAPPAEKQAMAPGGVDMRTGRYVHDDVDLSIGDTSEAGGLALKRTPSAGVTGHISPLANFTHNWDITLYARPVDVASGNYTGGYGPDVRMEVSFGGRTSTFQRNSSETYYTQISYDSWATLTFAGSIGTYTAKDGTVVTFRAITGNDCSNAGSCAFPSRITYGDGTALTFEYETQAGSSNTARLRSIVSNHGYAMLFEYGGASWNFVSKACVVNLAVTAKPGSNICPSGATSTTYGYGTFDGATKLTSVTDSGNNIWSHTYVSAGGGAYDMGFVKPGASSPWMTNTVAMVMESNLGETEHVFNQAFADGSSYSYNYEYTPQVDGQISSVAGGTYSNALNETTQVNYAFPVYPRSMNPRRTYVNGVGQPPTQYNIGDVVFQVTPGPAEIVDPLGRATTIDNCDPVAMAGLPSYEHQRCVVKRIDSITEPEGNKTFYKYEYSFVTQVKKVAKPGSGLADIVVSAAYYCTPTTIKSCDKPVTFTDAKGAVTNFTYSTDHGGILTETRPAPTSGSDRPQKRYSYGQFYAWHKDASGAMVQAPSPVWLPTAISECSTGSAPGCIGTANETRTTFTYGAPGTANNLLLVSKTVATGDGSLSATTSWTYDTLGNKLSEDGPLPGTADTKYWRYDSERRVTGTIAPDPDGAGALPFPAVRTTYDTAGRAVKVEQGSLATYQGDAVAPSAWSGFTINTSVETTYDALDRKLIETQKGSGGAAFAVTQYSYDLAGRLECTAVRMNPAAWASLPASACTLGTAGTGANDFGPDRITKLVYDAAGQLLQKRVAVGTADEVADVTYSYTPNGKQRYVIDANGNRAELRYDGFNRQASWVFPSNGTSPASYNDSTPTNALASAGAVNEADYEAYTYDANGNRTTLRKRDGSTLGYSYDALNRLTAKNVPSRAGLAATHTRSVYTGFDLRGLQTYARFDSPSGEGMSMTYDGFGRLTSTTTVMDNVSRTLSNEYDENGNRTFLFWPDGSATEFAYDGLDRMKYIVGDDNGSNFNLATRFYFDAFGRKSQQTSLFGQQTTYSYDPAARLGSLSHNLTGMSADVTSTFAYNPASQIVETGRDNDAYAWTEHYAVDRPYTVNGLNQYTTAGTASFVHDANGNLASDGVNSFTYDIENRLVAGSGAAMTAGLRYDPLGRLYEVVGAEGSTTRFLYDGDELVAEYNGAGTLLRRYVHGTSVDDPVLWYEGSGFGDRRWLHADQQGSIVGISGGNGATMLQGGNQGGSGAGGTSIATNRYDEYGIPQSTNVGRFQYTGQAWLAELGMYYYKARIYSPTLGRFMQTDPIGYMDGPNLYAYVLGDPANLKDADGRNAVAAFEACAARPQLCAVAAVGAVLVGSMILTAHRSNNVLKGGRVKSVSDIPLPRGPTILESRKNDLPPTGIPGSEVYNGPKTKGYRYGPDGQKEQEWNAGHPGHPAPGDEPHVHDHDPRPGAPPGTPPKRGEPRPPEPGDMPGPPKEKKSRD